MKMISVRPFPQAGIFKLVKQYGTSSYEVKAGIKPLHRIFSLMRLMQCKTIVEEKIIINLSAGNADPISKHCNCYEPYSSSCNEYLQILLQAYCYSAIKHCYKIYFFSSKFNKDELSTQKNDTLLASCIVHHDELELKGTDRKYKFLTYVVEAIVKDPLGLNISNQKRGYTFNSYGSEHKIGEKTFSLQGNYFASQNEITNCCAHAATKVAIRAHFNNITSENINRTLKIVPPTRCGKDGLEISEIQYAIKTLSNSAAETFVLEADKLKESPLDFPKAIHHALESKLPVIFLFQLPDNAYNDDANLHAIGVVGHTFNEHNWWSYALRKYFYPKYDKAVAYLPSVLWCDNFIVQDDVLGPHYLIPNRFFIDCAVFGKIVSRVKQSFVPPAAFQITYKSPKAMIVYPSGMDFVKNLPDFELIIFELFKKYVNWISTHAPFLESDDYKIYFKNYYDEDTLVLRTLIVKKADYLKNKDPGTWKAIESIVPDICLITEVSIPEIYWVNRKKVGEIVANPLEYNEAEGYDIKLFRLPNLRCIPGESIVPIENKDILEPLIESSGLF